MEHRIGLRQKDVTCDIWPKAKYVSLNLDETYDALFIECNLCVELESTIRRTI